MKKILIVTFIFPPLAGGGVQRTLKFVKYLPEFDYCPVVVTTPEKTYGSKDFSLIDEIPEKCKVYRVNGFYPMNLMPKFRFLKLNQVVSFFSKHFLWPDAAIFWQKKAFEKACEIIKNENIKIVYTTGGPFSNHITGLKLKKRFPELKWIADFRDEWTTNPHVKRNYLRKLYEKRFENLTIYYSDKIILITEIMKNNLVNNNLKYYLNHINKNKLIINNYGKNKVNYKNIIKYKNKTNKIIEKHIVSFGEKFNIISNGYDEEDFNFINNKVLKYGKRKNYNNLENKNDIENDDLNNDILNIGYNGGLYDNREPYYFFKAIFELINENKIERSRINLSFAGYKGILIKNPVKKFKLNDIVKIKGYLNHKESIKFINKMDVLLLIIGNFKGAETIVTGKIYEYLRLGKPIIVLGPENGLAWNLVKEYGTGFRCDINDTKCMKKIIFNIFTLYFKDKGKLYPDDILIKNLGKIKIFERKKLSYKLSKVLETI